MAVGDDSTRRFCEAIVHESAILQRVNDTAGQRWMPLFELLHNLTGLSIAEHPNVHRSKLGVATEPDGLWVGHLTAIRSELVESASDTR